ncbi:MAG: helicase HerA domain-containing protein [Thermoplasmata archaeon]
MMDYWPYESGTSLPLKGKRILFPDELQKAHSLVIGKTGTGKSSLLSALIRLYEGMGMTVIVLDPHGELWRHSSSDAKIITPSPVGREKRGYLRFNLMSILPYKDERERMINEDLVVHTLRDIFSAEEAFSIGTWGPRVELVLTLLPRLLLKYRMEPTIQDIAEILLDYHRRKDFMSSLEQDERRQLYFIFSMGYEFISSTVNKILPLLSSDVSRNLFSSRRDFFDISSLKGTLYVELSGDMSPPSLSRPFSIMLLYKIWNNVLLGRMRNVVLV